MAGLKSSLVVFFGLMVACMQLQGSMGQTRHVVGDALGWTIPPAGAVAYTTWATQQNFTVGDVLVFNFTTGQHNVAQVSQAAYGPCTASNPISITTTGPATIPLTTAGTHYYICTVGTHCSLGQKLTINVSAAAAAPAPATPSPAAPTPAPVSPPSATPTPAPSTTTPPPPRSSPAPSPMESSPPAPPTSTPSPTSPTAPSPSGSTPAPTSSTTPPPPPPPSSSAPSLTAMVPASFLAVALAAFLY